MSGFVWTLPECPVFNPLCSFFRTKEQSLVLPDGVLKPFGLNRVMQRMLSQMEESVKTLQWIRCLAINAKNENRMGVVTHLRSIVPAGTTGELTLLGVIG